MHLNSIPQSKLITSLSLLGCATLLALSISGAQADEAQDHFKKGVALYKDKNYDGSLSELNLALSRAPKDATILRWIGFVNLTEMKYSEARGPLEQAVKIDDKSVVAHLNLGNVYDGLKMYSQAIDEFKTAANLSPDSADANYNMGLIYLKTMQWQSASDSLRAAVKLDTAKNAKPDPHIHDSLGIALQNSGDPRGAIAEFQKAIDMDGRNADYNYHMGLAWRKVGGDEGLKNSRTSLSRAVDMAQNSYEIREIYAETLFDLNQNAEAATEFSKAADLDKSQFNPAYNLGVAQARLNKQAEAEQSFTRAISLIKDGDDPARKRDAQNGLALAQLRQSKYDTAVSTLKQITADSPGDLVAWTNLAYGYHGMKNADSEIAALKSAIANGGSSTQLPQLRTALGALLYRKGDYTGALEQYQTANEARPNNAETLNGLALAEQQKGRIADAIKHFQAAVRANPKSADALNNLGVAYEARYPTTLSRNDLDLAYASYKKAVMINPTHINAKRNKARLEKSNIGTK